MCVARLPRSTSRARRRVGKGRSEVHADTDGVDEVAVFEVVRHAVTVVEEELVFHAAEEERFVLEIPFHARFGAACPGVTHAIAIDVANVGTDKGTEAAGVEVVIGGDAGVAVPIFVVVEAAVAKRLAQGDQQVVIDVVADIAGDREVAGIEVVVVVPEPLSVSSQSPPSGP